MHSAFEGMRQRGIHGFCCVLALQFMNDQEARAHCEPMRMDSVWAGDECFKAFEGFGDGVFGAGEFDEDVGISAGDDGTEHGVVRPRGFGAAEGWAVEVGAVGDDEGDFFVAGREFFAFGGGLTFELAKPAGDVGFDIAALACAEVVKDGFEGFVRSFDGVMKDGSAHGAGAFYAFPGGWGFEGEIGDFDGLIGLAD